MRNIINFILYFAIVANVTLCYGSGLTDEDLQRDYADCGVPHDRLPPVALSPIVRIVGGSNSQPGHAPWMAYIWNHVRNVSCGGTLVNDRWILTTASCFPPFYQESHYTVVLGQTTIGRDLDRQLRIPVKKILRHPGYNSFYLDYDVALMQLNSTVTYTRYIRPACIVGYGVDTDSPNQVPLYVGTSCTALGWGATRDGDIRSFARTLKEVSMPIFSDIQCQNTTTLVNPGDPKICAGGRGGHGTCQGDGGGPLLCMQGGKFFVHGLISSGIECGLQGIPDFFTDVGHPTVNAWISGVLRVRSI